MGVEVSENPNFCDKSPGKLYPKYRYRGEGWLPSFAVKLSKNERAPQLQHFLKFYLLAKKNA